MPDAISKFQEQIWSYYRDNCRSMPWRENPTPYNVVVSELMLQQTQVSRVLEKFPRFHAVFSNFNELAAASTVDLLAAWQGLGYNRRALYLHTFSQMIVTRYGGVVPDDPTELVKLPGIGPGTAGSIVAFAYNKPVVFIETNIRRVHLHHFFADHDAVADADIMPIIEQTLDREHPREWYYALMDYGTHLAKTVPNPNRRSKHYTRQSKFEGSDRQIRGAIIRLLLEFPVLTAQDVVNRFPKENPERIVKIMAQLTKEGFLQQR